MKHTIKKKTERSRALALRGAFLPWPLETVHNEQVPRQGTANSLYASLPHTGYRPLSLAVPRLEHQRQRIDPRSLFRSRQDLPDRARDADRSIVLPLISGNTAISAIIRRVACRCSVCFVGQSLVCSQTQSIGVYSFLLDLL